MAKCRCNEMWRCNRDIGKLVYVAAKGGDINKRNELMDTEVGTTESHVAESLAPDIRLDNSCVLADLNKGLATDTNAVLFTINTCINSLRNAYIALQKEDETYHAELLLVQQEVAGTGEN